MAVNLSPFGPKPQFELSSGLPAVGNKLFFYVAGSVNTKQNTYTDSTGSVANANPIVLDALGQPSTQIWFTAGQSYKVVYAPSTDTDPPTSPIWTVDNLTGINDTATAVDQWVASGLTPTFVSATQFTVPGDQTSALAVGRRVKCTVTAGTVYGRITVSAYTTLTTVTVVLDSGALDSGLSAVSLGFLTPDNSAIPGVRLSAGAWTFSNAATLPGATLTGDLTMSGASIVEAEGAAVASASSCNIWATDGNTVHITGTITINDFATAPQAGAWMKVIFDDALTLTQSANLNLNAGGSNITTAAGDMALVYADTTTQMDVFLIRKSGQANAVSLSTVTNSLGADVALNNTTSYFNGPSVAQGTVGTWFFSGTVTVEDTGAAAIFDVKLTDGATVIASASKLLSSANNPTCIAVSGTLTNPAGNVTIQVKDRTNTTGQLRNNYSGNGKDCTLSAIRIA